MEQFLEKRYPVDAKDYKLYEEVGEGVSAAVHRALCIPFNEIVAIKILDLERGHNDLDGIRREVHMMSLIDHPNVLRAHCSFTAGQNLWVVMPYMAGGSCLHIMKSNFPEGFEERVIATILCETLKALAYLHYRGHIHRDIKAGNILIDSNGAVKLGDFGVSAWMFDMGDRQRSRNTFVGTPCWMAPEVMQQLHGYDFKADIWSFGITALELAHGHAPFSKYPPMKVLLMTLQNAPPGLDYERDKRFSKSFKELVAACLVKDPKKRPTSEKLLKHHFFKNARSNEYLANTILDGLPPLGERFRTLKAKEADLLVHNKALYGDKEQLSQQEYIRGISAWNFNLEDLKNQAAHIPDDESISSGENQDCGKQKSKNDDSGILAGPSPERITISDASASHEDGLDDLDSLEGSLASFPVQPLKALKGYFDVGDYDVNAKSPGWRNSVLSDADLRLSPETEMRQTGGDDFGNLAQSSSLPQHVIPGQKKILSGPLLQDHVTASRKHVGNGDRDILQARHQSDQNYSGPLLYRQKRDTNNLTSVEDVSEGAVVQRKGRFKVTAADVSPKGSTNCSLLPVPGSSAGAAALNLNGASILPSLQYILQQNNMQREEILKLIKYVEQTSGNLSEFADAAATEHLQSTPASTREGELFAQVIHLQQRIGSLVEDLQRQKMRNAELERQLSLSSKKEPGD
ncbi:hypothetical protein Ancab_025754 [Ancistrocladus abbreviatus]